MRRLRIPQGLPLLSKELTEQAARPRTYIIRTLYAFLLFAAAYFIFYETFSAYQRTGGNPFGILGQGRQMFEGLIYLQFTGIYLFMPALTCGVITGEKERNTFGLLLLTKLSPGVILLEKYCSRLVTMGTFLLLSMPLLAFTYSLGGVTREYLTAGVVLLVLAALQAGAVALLCSAWFRTTVAAFVASYLIGAALLFGPILLFELRIFGVREFCESLATLFNDAFAPAATGNPAFMGGINAHLHPWHIAGSFFPPMIFENSDHLGAKLVTACSVPVVLSTLFCLLAARVFVVRRAFVLPRSLLMTAFKALDRLFWGMNDRFTRGVVLVKDSVGLPEEEPIAWRETSKKSLGTVRYLFRVFVVLEFPVVFVLSLAATAGLSGGTDLRIISVILFFLWGIAALILSVSSASLIAGERTHETLDVLLATPLTSREIVTQKFRGVRRQMIVLSVPLFTIILFQTFVKWGSGSAGGTPGAIRYLFASALSVIVYFQLIAWLSFLIGVRVRNQSRAIFGALFALAGWCTLPFLIVIPFMELFLYQPAANRELEYLLLFSPATILGMNEFDELGRFGLGTPWVTVILNFLAFGAVLRLIQRAALQNVDRYLGRVSAVEEERRTNAGRLPFRMDEERQSEPTATSVRP